MKTYNTKIAVFFIVLNIENFYPSISLPLFHNASQFSKKHCDIPDNDNLFLMHARNTFLFSDGEPWFKKNSDENFDVSMNCYDGVEICKLIGTYLL